MRLDSVIGPFGSMTDVSNRIWSAGVVWVSPHAEATCVVLRPNTWLAAVRPLARPSMANSAEAALLSLCVIILNARLFSLDDIDVFERWCW